MEQVYQNGGLVNYNDCPWTNSHNFGYIISREKMQEPINFLAEHFKIFPLQPIDIIPVNLSFKGDFLSDKHWNGFDYDKDGNLIDHEDTFNKISLRCEQILMMPNASKQIKICLKGTP